VSYIKNHCGLGSGAPIQQCPPLISHVPVAGLNKNRARSQSHPQRRPRVYTHIQCIRLCREIKNYYRQCKSTVSRKGISSLLALSQLQYKQTLFHNRKHNYCFKCVRISRHHKSIFEIPKNASGRNSDFYTIILNTVRQSSSGVRDYAEKEILITRICRSQLKLTINSFIIAPRLHYRHEFEVSASTTIRSLSNQRHNR
jgi:hypothetical protein